MKSGVWIAIGVLAVGLAVAGYLVLKGRGERVVLTLVPGRSVWEAAETIDRALPGTKQAVLARAADEAWARAQGLPVAAQQAVPRADGVAATWLEGFVYPETYFIASGGEPTELADEVLGRATRQFKKVFAALQASHAAAFASLQIELGLGPAEVVVLASLVEEETARRDEAPRVAGVFLNRLRRGMRLETDPTLMYRPDRVAKRPSPSERRDASNPYNTYVIKGLPPGPICSPSESALRAVLEAEVHDFIFFVSRRDGTGGSAFAATLEEHQANIDRYLKKPAPAAPPAPDANTPGP